MEGRWVQKSGTAEGILYRGEMAEMRYEGRERRKTPLPMRTCVLSQIQSDMTEMSEVQADCA